MTTSLNPNPSPDASSTLRGLVNKIAQSLKGFKTFVDGIAVPANKTVEFNGVGGNLNAKFRSSDGLLGFTNNATGWLGFFPGTGRSGASHSFFAPQFEQPSSSRVLNVPGLLLPGSSGGYGYGGAAQIGGDYNVLQNDGSFVYLQSYLVPVELRGFGASAIVGGFFGASMGASDVATKLGTRTAPASVNDSAKLVSILAGIAGTEVVYAWFKKAAGAFSSVLTIDQKSQTHIAGLALINTGAGDTGIIWEGPYSAGGVTMGLGSQGTRGLFTASTNRTQSWLINSDAYSGSARASFDWEAAGGGLDTKPLTRYQAGAAQTADLAQWLVSGSIKALVSASGFFQSNGTITAFYSTAGGAFSAASMMKVWSEGLGASGSHVLIKLGSYLAAGSVHDDAEILRVTKGLSGTDTALFKVRGDGRAQIMGAATLGFETFASDLTAPPVGGPPHEITINAAKGRGIHAGLIGTTKVNCNKCTADSVVVVVVEDVDGGPMNVAVTPDNGFFMVLNDGGGYWDVHFRFVVFN